MEYLKMAVMLVANAILEYRIVGPSDLMPTAAEGYTIDPDPITFEGIVEGKFWIEYRIIEA